MNYSITWLQHQLEQGVHAEYFFYWGHTPKQEGIIDKSCFSQWYPAAFTVDGISYATAEHWMMAKKALLFGDDATKEKILAAEKPAIAKTLGREIINFDAAAWDAASYSIVIEGNIHKFSQHAALKAFLINTGNKILVEASPADAIWGIELSQDASEASNPFKWRGRNLLGFALMEVRNALRKQL